MPYFGIVLLFWASKPFYCLSAMWTTKQCRAGSSDGYRVPCNNLLSLWSGCCQLGLSVVCWVQNPSFHAFRVLNPCKRILGKAHTHIAVRRLRIACFLFLVPCLSTGKFTRPPASWLISSLNSAILENKEKKKVWAEKVSCKLNVQVYILRHICDLWQGFPRRPKGLDAELREYECGSTQCSH